MTTKQLTKVFLPFSSFFTIPNACDLIKAVLINGLNISLGHSGSGFFCITALQSGFGQVTCLPVLKFL